jgi:PAS domain S-box-containing protein
MSDKVTIDLMKQMLERLPGVTFCSRMHPKTWEANWLYVDERIANFYGVPMEQVRARPMSLLDCVHPEDQARVQGEMAQAIEKCGPMETTSRLVLGNGEIRWMETHANIERDTDGTVLWYGQMLDVTSRKRLEESLAESQQALVGRNEELAKSEEDKTALIERLRYAVDELSNPILEVWDDVLVMPIIGIVDSRRISDMVQRLLAEVTRTQASFVIVDLTGVEIVDTKTADHLIKLMRKVEIVGARCVLTGIRPAVSETLVDIGVDFGRVMTLKNLKHGLREALRHKRSERDVRADLGNHEDLEDETLQKSRRRAS